MWMNKSLRRFLLQQLIKMSFWNINIIFRTKTLSSQLRVLRAGPGILKCETIDPWQASEPEPESEANTVTRVNNTKTLWGMHAANVERIMNTRV